MYEWYEWYDSDLRVTIVDGLMPLLYLLQHRYYKSTRNKKYFLNGVHRLQVAKYTYVPKVRRSTEHSREQEQNQNRTSVWKVYIYLPILYSSFNKFTTHPLLFPSLSPPHLFLFTSSSLLLPLLISSSFFFRSLLKITEKCD